MKFSSKLLEKAIVYAVKKHKGQTRKGDGRPYIMHPISVMTNLYSIKKSRNLFLLAAAAVLHDVVEDCDVPLKKIAKKFGYEVAALVGELTLNKEKYKVLGKENYLKKELLSMSSYALCIKLCDRLDNVRDLQNVDKEFRTRYLEETSALIKHIVAGRKLTDTHILLIELIEDELTRQSTKE